jgi:hypothetical protein
MSWVMFVQVVCASSTAVPGNIRVAISPGQMLDDSHPQLCSLESARCCNVLNFPLGSDQAHSASTMSQVPPAATTSTNFETIFTAALQAYKKKTKKDIASHPLATQLQSCDSSSSVLAVLRSQVQTLDQSQSADEKWTKWLDPTVNVLSAFSVSLKDIAGPVSCEKLGHPRSILMYSTTDVPTRGRYFCWDRHPASSEHHP